MVREEAVAEIAAILCKRCAGGVPSGWRPGGERALLRTALRNFSLNEKRSGRTYESFESELEDGDTVENADVSARVASQRAADAEDAERQARGRRLLAEATGGLLNIMLAEFRAAALDPVRRRHLAGRVQTWNELVEVHAGTPVDEVIRAAGEPVDVQSRNRRYQNFKRLRQSIEALLEGRSARERSLIKGLLDTALKQEARVSALRGLRLSLSMVNGEWQIIDERTLDLAPRARAFAQTGTDPTGIPLKDFVLAGMNLEQVAGEPIVYVELDHEVVASGGDVRVSPRAGDAPSDRRLDGREGEAWLTWRLAGVEHRLSVGHGKVSISRRGTALADWAPVEFSWPEVVVDPVLDAWRERSKAQPWLETLVRASASGTVIQRASVLATYARYVRLELEVALEGNTPWTEAVSQWKAAAASARQSLLGLATTVAGSLLDDLDELDGSAAQQSDAGRAQILRWLTVRDDLESVRQLAERTSDDLAPLTRALEEIDSRASASVVTFERGRPRGQPRFQALAWMEPEAWWGES
jgi:hypothetical protein